MPRSEAKNSVPLSDLRNYSAVFIGLARVHFGVVDRAYLEADRIGRDTRRADFADRQVILFDPSHIFGNDSAHGLSSRHSSGTGPNVQRPRTPGDEGIRYKPCANSLARRHFGSCHRADNFLSHDVWPARGKLCIKKRALQHR